MPNDGIRLKIILIIEVRKLEFTDFDSHSLQISIYFKFLGSIFHSQYYAYIRLGYEKLNDTSQVLRYPYTALSTY